MSLTIDIAKRYLFGKKSTNAINWITGISVAGIAIGTAALILILSVFNGFEGLLSGLFNAFNPDIKIELKEGKLFDLDSIPLAELKQVDGVEYVSKTIEEIALFEYKGSQKVGTIKGVDELYSEVTAIDSTLRSGKFLLQKGNFNYAVLGAGMNSNLAINHTDAFTPVKVHMLLRKKRGPLSKEFKTMELYPSGVFSVQSEADVQYVITSYDFVNRLLDSKNKITSLEVKINADLDEEEIMASISNLMGDRFKVKNRYQQDEAFLKIMNIEKWISYLIACLTLFIIAFNLVGSLWMIVLEKKKDISILRSMGFTTRRVKQLFLWEGILICGLGLLIGLVLTLILYFLQKNYGIVSIPDGFLIDAYPIELKLTDLIVVIFTVLGIGYLASLLPAIRAGRITASVRQE